MKTFIQFVSEQSQPDNYKEMKDWFVKRTKNHINLVRKYAKRIENYDKERFKGLYKRTQQHDQSKFQNPEMDPYVYIAWQYKCKDDGKECDIPDDIDAQMNKATEHHVKSNAHHPEYHSSQTVDLINRADRDKPPEKKIDATKMKDIDVAEMVADWCAMSEEKGNTPKEWADKNVNIRWKFTPQQSDLIYELIDKVF